MCLVCVDRGTLTAEVGARVLRRTRDRLQAARGEIDTFFPDLGLEAVWWWFMQCKWWKWWRGRPQGGCRSTEWTAWTPSLELALAELDIMWPGLDRLSFQWGKPERGYTGEVGNVSRRHSCWMTGTWAGESMCISIRHKWACRPFHRLGGHIELAKIIKRLCKGQEEARWAAMRQRLENFFIFGSCSGRPAVRIADSDRIEVIIGERQRPHKAEDSMRQKRGTKLTSKVDGRPRQSHERAAVPSGRRLGSASGMERES